MFPLILPLLHPLSVSFRITSEGWAYPVCFVPESTNLLEYCCRFTRLPLNPPQVQLTHYPHVNSGILPIFYWSPCELIRTRHCAPMQTRFTCVVMCVLVWWHVWSLRETHVLISSSSPHVYCNMQCESVWRVMFWFFFFPKFKLLEN